VIEDRLDHLPLVDRERPLVDELAVLQPVEVEVMALAQREPEQAPERRGGGDQPLADVAVLLPEGADLRLLPHLPEELFERP
jgi:hypothetical protein